MDSVYKLYSIYDMMANKYGPIFEAFNDEVATRQYCLLLDKIDKRFRKDYKLYSIGSFDFQNGRLDPFERPEMINVNYTEEDNK